MMKQCRSVVLSLGCLTLAAASFAGMQDGGEKAAPPVVVPPPQEETYQPPAKPLDDRIDAEKITEYDPPPLPERVILPMPPDHRINPDPAQVPIDAAKFEQAKQAIERGLAFLRTARHDSGGWMMDAEAAPTDQPRQASPVAIAVTALAIKAFVQFEPEAMNDPALQKALRLVVDSQQDDGSFDSGALSNYVTSTAVSALAAVDDQRLQDQLVLATKWLTTAQWDQGEGLGPRQDWFGGSGYGNHGRPDLSNTQMMLEALYDAGVSPGDPAYQRALAFLQRAQNLKATNSAPWVGNDGGFVYTPANGGESMASEYAGEGRHGELSVGPAGEGRSLRSYGSMTYAGFKSMLYAGLSADDLRVRAAFDWIRNHWTFDENPGVGQQGLYYYYHAIARALRVAQQNTIEDAQGVKHNWREELIDALLKRQREDGSWVNEADRWMEGDPALVTIYSVLALEEALK